MECILQGAALDPEILTFDMYGTLIDWETGLGDALQRVFAAHGVRRAENRALQLFARHEAQVGAGDYLPYRNMLAETLNRIGAELGFTPTLAELRAFADSVGDWPAFDDSRDALLRLQKHFKLAVITNCDDEHFAMSNRHLRVEFDYIVTAELARSYKPSLNNFLLALGVMGAPRQRVLHVAESLYHDHVPAKALGLSSVWINRRHDKPGHGATPSAATLVTPDAEYPDMAAFADAILGNAG